ncbi:hypothetical protein [Synechococcus sp. C9]|uniref:hypothetical protein n=1 Tax=Synechococcus sp. C9 TaxID=102119 RepID=UPI001FF2907C|nr:hypothetical protein [Synechococcus sp. C9]
MTTTATQPQGHRSKIEKVLHDKGGLVISAPVGAPRVRLGFYPPASKFFLYLAFETVEAAMETFNYLLEKGKVTRYRHQSDSGINLPRPSEYFPSDIYKWEIKIHRPTADLVDLFIRLDKKRQKETVNNPTPVSPAPKPRKRRQPEQFGVKEYPQDHAYYA